MSFRGFFYNPAAREICVTNAPIKNAADKITMYLMDGGNKCIFFPSKIIRIQYIIVDLNVKRPPRVWMAGRC